MLSGTKFWEKFTADLLAARVGKLACNLTGKLACDVAAPAARPLCVTVLRAEQEKLTNELAADKSETERLRAETARCASYTAS